MANPRDDYDYEPQPEKVKKEKPQKKAKKKGGFFGKLVAVALGFILGVGSVYGSWALTGLGIALIPVGKTVGAVDFFAPELNLFETVFGGTDENDNPTAGILDIKYSEGNLGDIIKDVTKAVQGAISTEGNISALNETFPIIGTGIDNLLKSLDGLSLDVDRDELMEKPFNDLGKYIGEAFMNAPAGDVLGTIIGGDMPEILMMLCYGEKDVDYTVDADGNVTMVSGEKIKLNELFTQDMTALLDNLTIDAFISIDPNDPEQEMMMSIAYGSADRYSIVNGEVVMNQIVYTYEDGAFYDEENTLISCTITSPQSTGDPYTLHIDDGSGTVKTLYAKVQNDNSAPVYTDFECQKPLRYKKNTVASLSESAQGLINDITLASVLNLNPTSHPVLLSLAYGTKGTDYKIENDEIIMLGESNPRTIKDLTELGENLINDIPLSDLISASDNTLVTYLLYGKENLHYKKDGDNVVMNQRFIYVGNDKVYNEYEELLSSVSFDKDTLVYTEGENTYYCDLLNYQTSLKDGTTVNQYTLFADEDKNDKVYFSATTLGDFAGENNSFNNLTSRLTIGELMTVEDSNRILHLLKDETIKTLPNAINELKLVDVYPDMIYDAHGNLNGEWEYMFKDPASGEVHTEYTINDMNKLVDNMKQNIQHATLYDLRDHGLIEESTDLDIEIKRKISLRSGTYNHNFEDDPELSFLVGHPEIQYIGQLSVSQTMTYMLVVFDVISEVEVELA